MEIENTSIIVTGGASGLGAASAAWLAERGGKLSILDIDDKKGAAVASAVGGIFVRTDVTDETQVESALDEVKAEHGVARVLVSCAGIAPALKIRGYEGAHPLDAFRRTLEINLVGPFLVASRLVHRLIHVPPIQEERGVIIFTSSIAAFDGHVGHAAYASSKAGLVGMTLPLTRELCADAIRVMTIAPGLFDTPMMAGVPGAERHSLGSQVPHPARLGKPEEFAMLVEAIICNPMLNGEVIRLDGGLRLGPQ